MTKFKVAFANKFISTQEVVSFSKDDETGYYKKKVTVTRTVEADHATNSLKDGSYVCEELYEITKEETAHSYTLEFPDGIKRTIYFKQVSMGEK